MTSLILTDDSKQYQDLARDFSRNEIAPRAESFDHSGQKPKEIWQKVWEVGLANMQVPEEFGGLGLSCLDATVVAEELGAGCAGISAAFWGTDLAVAPLLVAGTAEQKKKFVEPLTAEFGLGAFTFGGTLSERNGKISGEAYCLNARDAKFITAKIDTADGAGKIFVVEKEGAAIRVGEQMTRIGLKAADIATVYFNDAQVSDINIVGKAHSICAQVEARVAPLLAAYATGMARAAMEHAIKYSKERHTFGQPIANHQGVQFMLADMAKNIEASRLMTRKAAWMIDHNEASTSASAAAKNFALDTAMQAATDAVQVYGGYGYSREYPVEKLMRDAKTLTALFTNPIHTKIEFGKALVAAK
jgi:acyl-CoA dehydrogenase